MDPVSASAASCRRDRRARRACGSVGCRRRSSSAVAVVARPRSSACGRDPRLPPAAALVELAVGWSPRRRSSRPRRGSAASPASTPRAPAAGVGSAAPGRRLDRRPASGSGSSGCSVGSAGRVRGRGVRLGRSRVGGALGAPAGRDADRVRVRRLAGGAVAPSDASRSADARPEPARVALGGAPAGRDRRCGCAVRRRSRSPVGVVAGRVARRRGRSTRARGAAVGSGAWNSIAGAAARWRAERAARRCVRGVTAAAANGESVTATAFLVDRRGGLLGRRVGRRRAGRCSAGAGLRRPAAAFFAAVLRRGGLLRRGLPRRGRSSADVLGWRLARRSVFFVARFRVVFLAGLRVRFGRCVSVVRWSWWICSSSSMDGAPVVPRAPGSAPHGDCVGRRRMCRRRKPVGGDGELETSGAVAARTRLANGAIRRSADPRHPRSADRAAPARAWSCGPASAARGRQRLASR